MQRAVGHGVLGAYAEDATDAKMHRSFTTEDGKTVEVVRGVRHNDEGDVVAGRAYRVTDHEGDVVAAGVDRAYRSDEGVKGISHRRMRTNEDGNLVTAGRDRDEGGRFRRDPPNRIFHRSHSRASHWTAVYSASRSRPSKRINSCQACMSCAVARGAGHLTYRRSMRRQRC